jgi:class 3 adenylate cyclase
MISFKNIFLLSFIVMVIQNIGYAQIDGKRLLNIKKHADSLLAIGVSEQELGNFSKSIECFNKSLKNYNENKYYKKSGDCYNYIAISYLLQGNYNLSLLYFEKSILEYKKVNYKSGISFVTNNMGGTYYYLGKFPQALNCYQKVLDIQKEIKDQKTIAGATQNIGGIYSDMENYDSALKYFQRAYVIFTKLGDPKEIAQNLNSTGSIYLKLKRYENANKILTHALTIANKENDKQIRLEVLNSLGTLYYKQSDHSKALGLFNKTLQLAREMNSQQYIGECQISIGAVYIEQGKNKEATEKCLQGLSIAKKIGSISLKKNACDCLYKSYKSLNDNQHALLYYEKSNVFEDSLNSKEISNQLMDMEFQKQQLTDSLAFVKKEHATQIKHEDEVQKKEKQRNIIIVSLCFILVVAGSLWNRLRFVKKSREAIKIEKDRSEELLLNILPYEVAEELKEKGKINAKHYDEVSVLFTDFVNFTSISEQIGEQEMLNELNICFTEFDRIMEKYDLEKIKTIGDAYLAVSGLPVSNTLHAKNAVHASLEILSYIEKRKSENPNALDIRIGIHSGAVIAGIVGVKKFAYDIWGDTVNTAARMEQNSHPGKLNVSEATYTLLKDDFVFEHRGKIVTKGKGELNMYFINND